MQRKGAKLNVNFNNMMEAEKKKEIFLQNLIMKEKFKLMVFL